MSKNVGTADRVIRVTIGLIAITLTINGRWAPWGWIGIVPLVTGLVGYCPVYRMLGLNTGPV
ncbi:MAG: YgaP family membrane protein [Acidiferrobacteraceae bacterium]